VFPVGPPWRFDTVAQGVSVFRPLLGVLLPLSLSFTIKGSCGQGFFYKYFQPVPLLESDHYVQQGGGVFCRTDIKVVGKAWWIQSGTLRTQWEIM